MTSDGLVRHYYALVEDTGAPALNIVASRGYVYGKRCKCGHRIRHQRKDHGWVCGRCGKPWPRRTKLVTRKEVETSIRPGAEESRLARRTDLGVALRRLTRALSGKLYVASAMGYSTRRLAREAPAALDCGPMSKTLVAELVQHGRAEWERALDSMQIEYDPAP